jgi:hypothetical protein
VGVYGLSPLTISLIKRGGTKANEVSMVGGVALAFVRNLANIAAVFKKIG